MSYVQPGRELIKASSAPTSAFSRLDLPTLLRPRNATSGSASAGNCSTLAALIINRAAMKKGRGERGPAPLVRYLVFPAPLHDLSGCQHVAEGRQLDLPLQRESQHL